MMKISMTKKKLAAGVALVSGITLLSLGCSTSMHTSGNMAAAKKDGDITVPANYQTWPKFVSTVDKEKIAQVREIYINETGMQAKRGEAFPSGTFSVMELYAAKKSPQGELLKDSQGNLVKGELSKIFVMAKKTGWGAKQPAGTIDNGDWLYGAYKADAKTAATSDFSACRSCHLPLANKDYIARYDEHFDMVNK